MKKIKSAYEIAMERAAKIDEQMTPEEEELLKREEVKPLLADFYKNKIDAEGLWERFKSKDDEELYRQAQILLLDSIGLKTIPGELKRRREGILAIESLKKEPGTATFEQVFQQISALQERYKEEHDRYQEMYNEAMENAEMSLRPVRTRDGKTVMQLQQSLDEDTEERLKNTLTQLESQSKEMLARLLDEAKSIV